MAIAAAHTGGLARGAGTSQKSDDFSCVPLCVWDHILNADSYHAIGEQEFERVHGIDLAALSAELQRIFISRLARRNGAECET